MNRSLVVSYVLQYSKCKSKQDEDKSSVGQHLKIKYTSGLDSRCLGLLLKKKLLFPALFWFLWPACPLFSPSFFLRVFASGSWGKTAGDPAEYRSGAKGGAFLKGIITVTAEDVHGHSVNRLRVAREERASLLVLHTSLSNSSLNCGAVRRLLGWKTLMEDSF